MTEKVEVDEAELLRLRKNEAALGAILKNPAARKKLAGAVKDVLPEDPLAKEADKLDPVEQRFDELSKQNRELTELIAADKAQRERDSKMAALQSEHERGFAELRSQKWTADGIAAVKKVMEEKGILDVAIAAKWVESQMPPQNPVTPGGTGSWGFMDIPSGDGDADIKKLIETKGENAGLLHKMAHDAIAEVRGTPRR